MTSRRNTFTDVWSVLILSLACLYLIQYVTVRSMRDFVLTETLGLEVADIRERGARWILSNLDQMLQPIDYVLIVCFLGLLIFLVYLQVAHGRLSRFIEHLSTCPRSMLLFLALVSAVTARSYLNPGQVFMGDAETHTLRSWMVAEHLRNFSAPVWSNYWYGGYPLLEFYAPGFFTLVAGLSLVTSDIDTATKLVLWLSHVGSSVTMYLFLEKMCRDRLGAMLGALAYTLIFHRLHIVLYQGDLQLSLIYLIYPLPFYFLESHLRRAEVSKRAFLMFTGSVAALIISHHGYAFFGLVFFIVYGVVRVLSSKLESEERVRVLGYMTLVLCCATLLSAFLLVPFIMGQSDVRGMPDLPFVLLIPNYLGPTILADMLQWTPVPREQNVGYLGVTVLGMALVASIWVFRHKVSAGMAAFTCALVSLLMVQSFTQYNVKNVNFFVFFAAALCAYALQSVTAFRLGRPSAPAGSGVARAGVEPRMALMAIAVLLLDLGPLTFQNVYREGYTFKQEMYERLLERGSVYKTIERQVISYDPDKSLADQFNRGKLGTISAFAPLQTPLGYFHEGSGKSFAYNVEITKQLQFDLNSGSLSDTTLDGLYLLGVKFLLLRDRFQYFPLPVEESSAVYRRGKILELRHARPLLMSTALTGVSELPGYDPENVIDSGRYFDADTYAYDGRIYEEVVSSLIQSMSINRERGTAERLIVRRDGPYPTAEPAGAPLEVAVLESQADIDSVRIRYKASRSGFGRLAYSYFPYLRVDVDGARADFFPSAMNYIIVELPAGEHVVTVNGAASPLRRYALMLSLGVLAVLLLAPGRWLRAFEHDGHPHATRTTGTASA